VDTVIVVATTLAAFVMDNQDTWKAWTYTAEQLKADHPDGVQFFAAIEVDGRGLAPFQPLLDRLAEIGGEYWAYMLDDGRTEVTTANRLRHLTMGQNLASDYAQAADASHMLFMAADCMPPSDAISKLLEVNHPFVGGEVTTYCLHGPDVAGYDFPVEAHMPTAAFVLIARNLFKVIKWRWDSEAGMSDDPAYYHDALTYHGVQALVRKDCVGKHYPESIGPIESRGHDMTVHRADT
jgi:hypothetical protein